jgi:hypothetical protein
VIILGRLAVLAVDDRVGNDRVVARRDHDHGARAIDDLLVLLYKRNNMNQ